MFYIWLFLVIILSITEMITVNLVSIWFVISGIVTLIVSLFVDNIVIQLFTFTILGIILMLLTKKIVKKLVPKKEKTNIDRIVGMNGLVLSKIRKTVPGEVKVDGKIWTAYADKTIDVNKTIEVLEINSTKLIVKEVDN